MPRRVLSALAEAWKQRMATNRVDLRVLLSNGQGGASLSRLQPLVVTFVIAAGFVCLSVKAAAFPGVNNGVLVPPGISRATCSIGGVWTRRRSRLPQVCQRSN